MHKPTRNFELRDSISVAVGRIQSAFDPIAKQVAAMRETVLSDSDAKLLIYQAFLGKGVKGVPLHLMSSVHDHYFESRYEEFRPRNLWSLSNAFTSAVKQLQPSKQFEVPARLGAFLARPGASKLRLAPPATLNRAAVTPSTERRSRGRSMWIQHSTEMIG